MAYKDVILIILTISIILSFGYMIGLVIYNNSKSSRQSKKAPDHQIPDELAEELDSLSRKLTKLANRIRQQTKDP